MSFKDYFSLRREKEEKKYESYDLDFSSITIGQEKHGFRTEYLIPTRKIIVTDQNQISPLYKGGKISYWNCYLSEEAYLHLIARHLIFQDTEFKELDCETNEGLVMNIKKEEENHTYSLLNNSLILQDTLPTISSSFIYMESKAEETEIKISNFLSFSETKMQMGEYSINLESKKLDFPSSLDLNAVATCDGITNCYKRKSSNLFFPSFASKNTIADFQENKWETRIFESIPIFNYTGTEIDFSTWNVNENFSRSFILNCFGNFPTSGFKKICRFPDTVSPPTIFFSRSFSFDNLIQPLITNLFQEGEEEGENNNSYYIKVFFQPESGLTSEEVILGTETYFISFFVNVTVQNSIMKIYACVQDHSLISDSFY